MLDCEYTMLYTLTLHSDGNSETALAVLSANGQNPPFAAEYWRFINMRFLYSTPYYQDFSIKFKKQFTYDNVKSELIKLQSTDAIGVFR